MTRRSPVPDEVAVELRRVVQRWHQLPLDHALSRAAALAALVQELADAAAHTQAHPSCAVPDLGPAALADQLAVVTYDACRAGLATDLSLASRLAAVRRSLG
ncbi:hypothetical protein [Luteipulveratus flavus]|uniref:Uncharacterized protein n=1 Tax=Luteipulveratus flavus TaxID=3031728 RepID=A0ABT6CC00_9MICO|nr:hypothetical protein [Luteipulveratus sp. YIM 133296]MDF8266438.1 hypothetical protein [Luteipulveratus sp. YIM 133296]